MTPPPDRSSSGARPALGLAVQVGLGLGLCSGCTAPAFEADLDSSQAFRRVPALVEAAAADHPAEAAPLGTLIEQLDDPDAAVRLFAIGALQRRTNQRFGYRWYRDAQGRREAVDAWKAWAERTADAAG